MEKETPTVEEKLAPWNDPSIRWVCEDHPTEDQSHLIDGKECGGAGMPAPTVEEWEEAQPTEPLTISERLWAWRYKYYPWERAETEAYSELVTLVLDIDKRARESELRRIKRMLENNV